MMTMMSRWKNFCGKLIKCGKRKSNLNNSENNTQLVPIHYSMPRTLPADRETWTRREKLNAVTKSLPMAAGGERRFDAACVWEGGRGGRSVVRANQIANVAH